MMKSTLVLCLAAMALASVVASQTNPNQTQSMAKNEKYASLFAKFDSAKNSGKLAEAKAILENQIIPEKPGASGNLLFAAHLCYEMQDYSAADSYFKRYEKSYSFDKASPEAIAQNMCFKILLQSAVSGTAPHWNSLPTKSSVLNPASILERECQIATADFYFRTAKVVLSEMKKIGASPETINILQLRLNHKIQFQKNHP